MLTMVACGVVVLAGLVAIARWGGSTVQPPPDDAADGRPGAGAVARRYLWHVTVGVVAGLGAGLAIAGAGGRLAMRLLAATAGDDAQGRLTEADEVVGHITVGGSFGLVVFVTLFVGLSSGLLYMLLRRWLPAGRLGGAVYGGLLLVTLGTRVEPLRADNPDFDIVGPGWLSVLVFGAMAVAHGMLVAALAGRYSRSLPLVSARGRSIVAYAPLLVLLPVFPFVVLIAFAGALAVGVARLGLLRPERRPLRTAAGRAFVAIVAVVALPGFVGAVADIVGRGP